MRDSCFDDRLPVWTALSGLFLDTELSLSDIVRIADVLTASPYDIDTLERILLGELLPVFGPNLLSIAGEWQPWDEIEVGRIMKKAAARGKLRSRIAILFAMPAKRAVLSEWNRLLPLLERGAEKSGKLEAGGA
ncbi:DUF7079 family protein [Novosphingobium sp. RL4]|uniref:DUF7079 family protein n=1 Tax=Novosphingobium sp. RL4 TaxID=3109595 RepID=UPI002D77EA94|nr:hypothetical protein [Novosphingobium sp. RL4]WRT94475.1 hypothetical protein U9J33_08225 [Novosphingobium sp. RL4]